MALSEVRSVFGIHSFSAYRRSDRTFYGTLRVLGSSSFSLTGENVVLNGGSNKYPWQVEEGLITAEISLVTREYPDWLFEVLLGRAVTQNSAEAAGSVSGLANVLGTSVVDSTTGIASIAATAADEADLKFAKYRIVAASPTTVDVFASSNLDFARGTDAEFVDDSLKINSSPITVPDASGTVALADFGLEITGGSGTVAMTAGDSAEFEVQPINTGSIDAVFGAPSDSFPEFGAIIYGKKQGSGRMFELDVYRVKGAGLPLNFEENAFSEASVTLTAFFDSARNGVFSIRDVTPTTVV